MPTTKLTIFVVNKDVWYTKEGRAMSSIVCTKGTSWAEATSKSKKIKPVALAIVELRESESIRQAVS